jgi:hypothetical protein
MEFTRLSGADVAKLNDAIEHIVRAEFGDSAIEAVHVFPEIDDEGDEILRVAIVLTSTAKFDPVKAKGLARHIFPALKESARRAFPLVSFFSKSDYARLSAAA